jgi:hypothetical protein
MQKFEFTHREDYELVENQIIVEMPDIPFIRKRLLYLRL